MSYIWLPYIVSPADRTHVQHTGDRGHVIRDTTRYLCNVVIITRDTSKVFFSIAQRFIMSVCQVLTFKEEYCH